MTKYFRDKINLIAEKVGLSLGFGGILSQPGNSILVCHVMLGATVYFSNLLFDVLLVLDRWALTFLKPIWINVTSDLVLLALMGALIFKKLWSL